MQSDALEIVSFGEYCSSGTVAEQYAGRPVFPVSHPGRLFCADDEHVLRLSGFKPAFGNVHRIDESGTRAIYVNAGACQSDFFGNDAAEPRCHILVHDIGTDEIIYILRFEAGHFESFGCRLGSEVLQVLIADYVPASDAGTRNYPLITCVEELRQHRIGHFLFRKCASCSDKFHTV